jgi:hypothetical protein
LMVKKTAVMLMCVAVALGASCGAWGQQPQDPEMLIAAQREAMGALSFMDGAWRGMAWMLLPSGEKHLVVQTERIGPFLGGSIKVIEGRGYEPDGTVSFNALGIVSFNPADQTYSLRSYAQGMVGDFPLTPTEGGYVWEIHAGPTTIRYEATVTDSTWQEVGDRVLPEQGPIRFFEMDLKRIGDTHWPSADPVPPE